MTVGAHHLPVRAVTSGPLHHFFGYYDKTPWDASGRTLLALEATFADRPPGPDDVATIGVVDLADGCRFSALAHTRAWNWQQGAMLQWLPTAPDRLLIYNDRQDGRFIAVVHDLRVGEVRTLPMPVYGVSHDGRSAMTLNFARLARTRPGYGYAGLDPVWAGEGAPDGDGVYWMDLVTGEHRLVIPLARLAAFQARRDMQGAIHWVNHLQFNPDDSRFAFLHRWSPVVGAPWQTRMLTARPDGSELHLVSDHGLVSHYDWRDPQRILAWARNRAPFRWRGARQAARWVRRGGLANHYFLFRDRGRGAQAVGQGVLAGDGHCSYSPDRRWILTDTYPDGQHYRTLILFDVAGGKRTEIGRFFSPPELAGECRCDLHPRWSRDGRQVCIDSAHEGGRQMYVLDVADVTAEARRPAPSGGES